MKKYLFTFTWDTGCVNDHIIAWLKANHISFHYEHQTLVADLYGVGILFSFNYEQVERTTFGIIAKQYKYI